MKHEVKLSIIIPTLNEMDRIAETLASVDVAREGAGYGSETIVVDGGSIDGTEAWLERREGIELLRTESGRAAQMNAGAQAGRGEWFLFLHADSRLEENLLE